VLATLAPSAPTDAATVGRTVSELLADTERRRAMASASRQIVDGLGARRVALALARPTLAVRPARQDDAQTMYGWRNDPVTRNVSNDASAISWETHLSWLDRVLANPGQALLIGAVGSIPVGVIRFDQLPDGRADVSLYLDPSLHGLGLGGELLRAGESFVTARHSPPLAFRATVLDPNVSSQRMFANAGYRHAGDGWVKTNLLPRSKELQ